MRIWAMRTGNTFTVAADERQRLRAIAAARTSPQKHVWRAQIILLSADGAGTTSIMAAMGKAVGLAASTAREI